MPAAINIRINFGVGSIALDDNLGIYEVDGDSLTICFGGPNDRPDRFESTEDCPIDLWVLRRVEEESE